MHDCDKEGQLGSLETSVKINADRINDLKNRTDEHGKKWREEVANIYDKLNDPNIGLATLSERVKSLTEKIGEVLTFRTILGGVIITIMVQIGGFIYLWGGLNRTVEAHERNIQELQELAPRHLILQDNSYDKSSQDTQKN